MSLILSLISKHKLIFSVAIVAILAIMGVGAYYKGYFDGKDAQAAAQVIAEREAVAETREIEKVVMRMPKNDVQKELEEKWCRDCR